MAAEAVRPAVAARHCSSRAQPYAIDARRSHLWRLCFVRHGWSLFDLRGSAFVGEPFDLVIYGGTSAGVMAAVQAKRMGKSVVLVSPDVASRRHVERRTGLDRLRRQVRDRRTGARVLPPHLAALPG